MLSHTVEVEVHTALGVGESHFKHSGEQTASADVVCCQELLVFHQSLHSIECVGKVIGTLHARSLVAKQSHRLCKGRATELHVAAREIDIVETALLLLEHRAYGFLHVAHLTASRDNHGAWGNHLLVAVFLGHRKAVLAGWNVDAEGASEIATSLHSAVETSVFTLVAAWPHPVGTQRNCLQTAIEVCAHNVGQCLGDREHRSSGRVDKTGLRRMADRGGDTAVASVVESHHTTVA